MGPYCLGLLTGYLLHKRPHIRLPNYLTWLLWLLLPPLSFTTLLLTHLWNGAYDDPALLNPSPLVSAFYVAIHRTIWTALVAWLVFACTTGRAKLLGQLLSQPIFVPISRLSYSIYLVHLPLIMFRSLNLRHTVEWTDQNILYEACGNFVASLLMGYFLNVTFESPIINLENYISGRDRPAPRAPLACADAAEQLRVPAGSGSRSGSDASLQGAGGSRKLLEAQKQRDGSSATNEGSESDSTGGGETGGGETSISLSGKLAGAQQSLAFEEEAANGSSLAGAGGARKPLQPKQVSATARVFGEIQATSANHQRQAGDFFSTQTSSSTSSGESSEYLHQEPAALERASELLERRGNPLLYSSKRATQRPYEPYELSASNEYKHYAPGGYREWRMHMNQGAAGRQLGPSLGRGRPVHYATLARTSRLGAQQERLMLERQQRLLMAYQQRLARRLAGADQAGEPRSRADSLAAQLDELQLARLQQASAPTGWRMGSSNGPPAAQVQGARQGRYNTLTGTRSRDSRAHLQHDRPASSLALETGGPLSPPMESRELWDEGRRLREWPEPAAGLWMRPGELGAEHLAAGRWLRQGPLIPRIDSSTLRRQQARRIGDSGASSSIAEEALDQEAHELDQKEERRSSSQL